MRHNSTRFIYMIFAGVLISILLHSISPVNDLNHSRFHDFFISIIITIIVWEGNLRIDSWMNKNFSWQEVPAKRIFFHFPSSIIFSVLTIYLPMIAYNEYVCEMPAQNKQQFLLVSLTIGVLISILILSIEISTQFFINWKKTLVEVEKYKTESLQAQLENLKNQINPHFLFNNLSVLSSLVYKDQDKAIDFIIQLSKVYRYVLDNKDKELVALQTELEFIHSYCYLLNIRFGSNILFTINVEEQLINLLMPPMALQMLVENAIKHNEVSMEQPLEVIIKSENNYLIVANYLQLRSNVEESSKTGLANIISRYKYFTEQPVIVSQSTKNFEVRIPLLKTI